ncbi:MIP/aquaporin family protein [Clostridium massiliamazoniense]|uniref:MIP/aquaporin family protein n=1 Tax=Clostridium massiliamazoniense TaxID=1347366 RepID=UPI0006D7BB37|nr:MIP/aquaporin family protein [Clostridium massiliamazoniense]
MGSKFIAEVMGTFILILLGDGVVANVVLKKNKGEGSGWIVITAGWALAVTIPVFIFANVSGAQFNPAVTIALAATGSMSWAEVPIFIGGQLIGAFLGAVAVFFNYYKQFEATEDPDSKLGVFATIPAIRNYKWNFVTEFIGSFILMFGILGLGAVQMADGLSAISIGLLIFVIGLSLGGPTGYAINPARDLGPRIAHFLLPIRGKGSSDWSYAWIPVVAPICGALVGAILYTSVFM